MDTKFSPHDCRRSFVSHMIAAGVDRGTVSKLAGHAQVTTTMLYDRRGERVQREAMRKVPLLTLCASPL